MSELNQQVRILIDKITVNYHDPDRVTVQAIADKLRKAVGSAFPGAQVRTSRAYSAFVVIPIPLDNPAWSEKLVLQADPYDRDRSSYRIEFNPSRVGPEGVADLDLILTSTLGVPAEIFISGGRITRTDLAVDLPGLTVDDVIVRSRYQRKHGVFSDTKGRPVTAYLGGARSNRTVTYDKITGRDQPSVLRLERRLLPKCLGCDLPALPDPFSKLALVRTEPLMPILSPIAPVLFFDSARVRGIRRAMTQLSSSQRKAIDKALKDPNVSILSADIWKTWPEALQSSGLASFISADTKLATVATPTPSSSSHEASQVSADIITDPSVQSEDAKP